MLQTVGPVRDQIRPFARDVRPTVRSLRPAAKGLSEVIPDLLQTFKVVNYFLNTLAYNPPGDGEEGYLFWASWANHLGSNIFSNQDAHGPIRRGTHRAVLLDGRRPGLDHRGRPAPRPARAALRRPDQPAGLPAVHAGRAGTTTPPAARRGAEGR